MPASGIATRFLDALGRRDFQALGETFAEDAQLRGLVPARLREEQGRSAIIERFRFWNDGEDWELLESEAAQMADLTRIRWRVAATDPDEGPTVYEQTAYAKVGEHGIEWMNLVCSGHR
jgi:hypothetical protein